MFAASFLLIVFGWIFLKDITEKERQILAATLSDGKVDVKKMPIRCRAGMWMFNSGRVVFLFALAKLLWDYLP